ncbi:TetR-like C-terminal domain-containing protein [uncultured Ruegeria sp.]|uniref:TetR-like C-terminal domain-containing protein n=1 Tax=uncultured Ruegeria sp. TaxID=259304 RepID=UPI00260A4126|nr:TetR-like C-terminal domain-containing protein [uncultured Ruegeria sp.]
MRADLIWLLNFLVLALNDTPWGQIAPQVIAAAATDDEARGVITSFMKDRLTSIEEVFAAAAERGEIPSTAPISDIAVTAVAAPYFRKLVAGLPIDETWLESHVDMLCALAGVSE